MKYTQAQEQYIPSPFSEINLSPWHPGAYGLADINNLYASYGSCTNNLHGLDQYLNAFVSQGLHCTIDPTPLNSSNNNNDITTPSDTSTDDDDCSTPPTHDENDANITADPTMDNDAQQSISNMSAMNSLSRSAIPMTRCPTAMTLDSSYSLDEQENQGYFQNVNPSPDNDPCLDTTTRTSMSDGTPGRKISTKVDRSERRKAQNRAAQRRYRESREARLKEAVDRAEEVEAKFQQLLSENIRHKQMVLKLEAELDSMQR